MKWRQLLTTYVLPCLLLLCATGALGQTRVITGTVRDTSGAPLAGASVTVRGAQTGTTTDVNGKFTLTLPSATKTLVVSYAGFKTMEVPVSNFTSGLGVRMVPGSSELNEVVVIGYGSVQKKDLTGAVTAVTSKDFQQGAITSPDQLIAGKIAGVSVTPNGGQPGSSAVIRIRGLASLNSNNDPLYVVDGAILPPVSQGIAGVGSPLDMINPDDIATITVLKDAASQAIYGSRASAGVIIITTKKGRAGKPVFNVNAQETVNTVAKTESVLNASQFKALVSTLPEAASAEPLLGDANTNWEKAILQTANTINVNASVSGSIKNKLPYRISAGYLDESGILITDKLQRGTAGIHLTPKLLKDKLSIELNVIGGTTNSNFANQNAIGAAVAMDPTQPIKTGNESQWGGYYEWMGTGGLINLATRNPVALLRQRQNPGYSNNSIGNLKLDYELPFVRGLHAIYNIGYDLSTGHGSTTVPGYAAQDWYNATATGSDTSASGYNNIYKNNYTNWFNEATLDYKRDFKSIKSNLDVMGTYGYYYNRSTTYSYPAYGANDSLISGSTPTYPIAPGINTLISYIGRVIYTYDNKYTLQGSIRDDGSSKFGPTYRWGVFPTVAGSWRISQEDFLKNVRWLTDLKVRASYGVTGNQDGIGDYGYIPSYYLGLQSSQYAFGNTYYYLQTPNPFQANLKWEQTASENFGIDFGIFNNRISGGVDYYYKKISNLFNSVYVPAGTNFTNIYTINIGDMTDRGVEANLNFIPVQNRNWTWNLNVNFAYNKNLITKLVNNSKDSTFYGDETGAIAGATGQTIQINTVGYTPLSFFVLQQIYGQNGKPLEGTYVDQNRDGNITEPNDQIHYHSPFAPVIMGLSTSVTYQKWTLSMVARANFGNWVYNNVDAGNGPTRYVYNTAGGGGYLSNIKSNYNVAGFYYPQFQSSYYVQNASFVKMDNLGLVYNYGKVWGRANLKLSVNCQNVFVITKYTGIDPEVYGGIDNNIYPRPRNFTLGASVNF